MNGTVNGVDFVNAIEKLLVERNILKTEFYTATEITSASFTQWRSGKYNPGKRTVKKVEDFFNIKFVGQNGDYEELGGQPKYGDTITADIKEVFSLPFGLDSSKFVAVPVDTLDRLHKIIDNAYTEIGRTPETFDAPKATEDQWRTQLNRCSVDQLLDIQKTIISVIRDKTSGEKNG